MVNSLYKLLLSNRVESPTNAYIEDKQKLSTIVLTTKFILNCGLVSEEPCRHE